MVNIFHYNLLGLENGLFRRRVLCRNLRVCSCGNCAYATAFPAVSAPLSPVPQNSNLSPRIVTQFDKWERRVLRSSYQFKGNRGCSPDAEESSCTDSGFVRYQGVDVREILLMLQHQETFLGPHSEHWYKPPGTHAGFQSSLIYLSSQICQQPHQTHTLYPNVPDVHTTTSIMSA